MQPRACLPCKLRLFGAGVVASAALCVTSGVGADEVIIPPTVQSSDQVQQMQNSFETVKEIFEAIHNHGGKYPGGSRTILLEEGVYDLRAVIIPVERNPDGSIPPPPVGHVRGPGDEVDPEGYTPTFDFFIPEPAQVYDPTKRPFPAGIPIEGRKNLTIRGTLDADGNLLTTLRGNPDQRLLGNGWDDLRNNS